MKNHIETTKVIAPLLTANKPYRTLRTPPYSADAQTEHITSHNSMITIGLHAIVNNKRKSEDSN